MNQNKILKKTIFKLSNKKVFGFDCETIGEDNEFFMCSLVGDNYSKVFYSKDDFVNELRNKRFRGSIICATNLGFDFHSVFKGHDENKSFKFLYQGSNLLYAKTWVTKSGKFSSTYQKDNITFLDTYNYAKISVKNAGKLIGVEKSEYPSCMVEFEKDKNDCFVYDKEGKKKKIIKTRYPKNYKELLELEEYNLQDSLISKKFLEFLFKSFQELGANIKNTIASTSMSLFRNKYLKGEYKVHKKADLYNEFKSYYGGRTEAFKRGKIENVNYYDFNSLYPSVMIKAFPDPNSMIKKRFGSKDNIKNYMGSSHIKIFVPKKNISVLPMKIDGKLKFISGELDGWWTHEEINKAVAEGGVVLKVFEQYIYTRKVYPFKDYVTDLYSIRKKLKADGNPMEQVVKLLLNSLYGKWGQRFWDRDNITPFNHTIEQLEKLESFEVINGYLRTKSSEQEPAVFCVPVWASYITSYARIKLFDVLKISDPYYCDTDSIITKSELPNGNELGELELEKFIDLGVIVKPKFYAYFSGEDFTVRSKGIITSDWDFEEFNKLLTTKKARYKKFIKFKESLRRDIPVNAVRMVDKKVSLEDDKRVWSDEFNALELQESRIISGNY